MFGFGLLSGLIFLPLVGAAFILLLRGDDEATRNNVRWTALITTLVTFLLSLWAWKLFDPSTAAFQLVEERSWLGAGLRQALYNYMHGAGLDVDVHEWFGARPGTRRGRKGGRKGAPHTMVEPDLIERALASD